MNRVQQVKQPEEFDQVLLSYAEMCYSVAFALTRNPRRAQDLARYALTRVWRMRDNVDSRPTIKQELLKALRERFLLRYRQSPCSLKKAATSREDAVATGQGLEGDVEQASLRVPTVVHTL